MRVPVIILVLFLFSSCQPQKILTENSFPEEESAITKKEKQEPMNEKLLGKWQLQYMTPVDGKQVKKLFQIQLPYLTFVDHEKVAGNNGCNNIAGFYRSEENEIYFDTENFRSTRMFCEGVDETAFPGILKTINRYEISRDGQKLFLLTGDIMSMTLIKMEDNN